MSKTVILSKSVSRQRPQPKESTMSAKTHPTSTTGNSVGDGVESMSVKAKAASSPLVLVKDLVRDNSRLVKDLMALLAIREATKDTPPTGGGAEAGEMTDVPLKNRPGNDGDRMLIPLRAVGGVGSKGAAVAAAVASLLHHTATKEFSSLAGEIIAIADDNTTTGYSNERRMVEPGGKCTNADGDGMMPTMLHADAAAAEPNPNGTATDDDIPEPATAELTEDGTQKGEARKRAKHDGKRSATQTDATGYVVVNKRAAGFLSGPVPVAARLPVAPRAATPLPPFSLPIATQSCECCAPGAAAMPQPMELTLEQKLDKLLDSVVKIKADMQRRIERLGRRVEQIHLDVQLNIDNTDRALLRNDLLLIGIPYRDREDLQHCFRCVCRALEYDEKDIPQVDVRRQRIARRRSPSREGAPSHPAPIVVEFMFKTLRDQFYRAYQAKRVLRLSDVGFAGDRRFFVNEVLTRYNQKLMGEAVRQKRAGLLHSVYTVDGIVYVQRVAGEKGTKVTSFASMN